MGREETRKEEKRIEARVLYLSDFKLSGNNWLRLSGFANNWWSVSLFVACRRQRHTQSRICTLLGRVSASRRLILRSFLLGGREKRRVTWFGVVVGFPSLHHFFWNLIECCAFVSPNQGKGDRLVVCP